MPDYESVEVEARRLLSESYRIPKSANRNTTTRIAGLLGFEDEERDELWLADRISAGLPPSSLDTIFSVLGAKNVVGTLLSASTLHRVNKRNAKLSRRLSSRTYQMAKVVDHVCEVYRGDIDAVQRFLLRPHQLLQKRSPFQVAASGSAGVDAVVQLVDRASTGVSI